MKVGEPFNGASNIKGMFGTDDRKLSDAREANFQGQLKHAEERSCHERLEGLVNEIVLQGEKLSKRADLKELKIYKRLVADFLDEALNGSRKFFKHSFLDRRGRQRVFAVVKKVDENLDALTRQVLSSEKDNIKILQRLDEIKGLILDIIM
jgi:uncharacterized protein YaaR (DUF327 family)